ncbi:MAG: NPCBM/NEW2 domain-containing protein [Deltaproteobacteria bacterium]|nr:NPCBM/NEW2 domain-containing protein [Deltaproteobacteria bacterium]
MPTLPVNVHRPIIIAALALTAPATAAPMAPAASAAPPNGVWLEDLDYTHHTDKMRPRASAKGTPLTIGGKVFSHGLGGTGRGQLLVRLGGRALRFVATVGIDDVEKSNGSKDFQVWLDDKMVASSGVLRKGQSARLDVDLKGADRLELIVAHGGVESDWDRFVIGDAQIVLQPWAAADRGAWPQPYALVPEPTLPLASRHRSEPAINGPRLVGATPGHPFLHRLAVTGQAPLQVTVTGLPRGLTFDAKTRTLRGTLPAVGTSTVQVLAKNKLGKAQAVLTIVGSYASSAKALTPLMGWNSWNVWGKEISAKKIRDAADALVALGLADHGFTYLNIDDGWEGKRDECGRLQPSPAFGDVAGLASELHSRGLKLGIYSSPGPQTCAEFEGSYGHEQQDAQTFAAWGVDLLKYDWCSFDKIAPDLSPKEQRRPYAVMQAALEKAPRDIVYSVCSYGRGEVWTWAAGVGASQWRTTSDISDSWTSLEGIAFAQSDKAPFAKPGHVNDPDMLVVGKVGWGHPRPTNLSGNEQILHVTHWAMVAAPLLLGCNLGELDDFTLDLLSNDEVLAVDQDALVVPAQRKYADGRAEVWSRPLHDGGVAVALYNRGPVGRDVALRFSEVGLSGKQQLRDLWQRKDLGAFSDVYTTHVPQHGAVMLKVTRPRSN